MKKVCRKINEKVKNYISNPALISYIKLKKVNIGINCDEIRQQKIIISLTSFPERFSILPLCLKSLLLQNYKPDKIIVWLDRVAMSKITDEMIQLETYGIEYRLVDQDIKSHKKYYYAMREFPNDLIITVDDDLVYPVSMVKSLIKMHKIYPKAICARRVHRINMNLKGDISKYYDWEKEFKDIKVPSHNLIATTGAGTLFPTNCLDERAFKIEDIKKHCFLADDIWVKFMAYLNNIKVVWVPCYFILPPLIKNSQKFALYKSNVENDRNDVYVKNVIENYMIDYGDMIK